MNNEIRRFLVGAAIAILALPAVHNSPAAAQAYGESTYGGGIYNDARVNVDGEGEGPPGTRFNSGDRPSGSTDLGDLVDEDSDKQLAETESDPQSDVIESDLDADDKQSSAEVEESPTKLQWVSLAAVAAFLLLIWAVIARKRRRERM